MAITALRLAATTDYVSDLDPAKKDNPSEATVWKIGTLDSRIFGFIKDKTTSFSVGGSGADDDSAETSIKANLVAFEKVQFGLRGWERFRDGQGNDIPFKTLKRNVAGKSYEIVSPDLMEQIPSDVIDELAKQIDKANEVSAALGNG